MANFMLTAYSTGQYNKLLAVAMWSFFCVFALPLSAQEDCFDGIDNDGNGFIDLNDPNGCICDQTDGELIANGDFENFEACPNSFSQMPAAGESFYYPNGGTSDFYHSCGYVGTGLTYPIISDLLQGDNGNGIAGFFSEGPDFWNYREYITQCLNTPLVPGIEYELSIDVATTGFVEGGLMLSNCTVLPLGLFGAQECPLNIGINNYNGCLSEQGDFLSLIEEDLSVLPNEFTTYTFTFTVDEEINSIAIGGGCQTPTCDGNDSFYFYLDNWSIQALDQPEPELPTISITGSSCLGFTITADQNDFDSYQWFVNGIAQASENDLSIEISADSLPEIVLGVQDELEGGVFSCLFSEAIQLEASAPISVEALFDPEICPGSTTTIALSVAPEGSYSFNWSNGETSSNIEVGIGSYDVIVTNVESGCSENFSYTINICQEELLQIALETDTICPGETTSLLAQVEGGVPPFSFVWSPDLGDNEGPFELSPEQSTNYTVSVQDALGFIAQASVEIVVLDDPDLSFSLGTDTSFCAGQSINLGPATPIPGVEYEWNTGQNVPQILVGVPGTYSLTLQSACSSFQDDILITRIEDFCDCQIYIPNAITANNDGLNEVFKVETVCEFDSFELKIFNRWGELVQTLNSASDVWQGNFDDGAHHNGISIYNYILVAYPRSNGVLFEPIKTRGSISVIR